MKTDESEFFCKTFLNKGNYITNTELIDENAYIFITVADDIFGNSTSRTLNFIIDKTPPNPPTWLVYYIHDNNIYFTWNINPEIDIKGYNIYRNNKRINQTLITTNFYADLNLLHNKYEYYITAIDYAGNESNSSQPVNIVLDGCLVICKPEEGSTNKNLTLIKADIKCLGDFETIRIEYGPGLYPDYWNILKETAVNPDRKRITKPWLTKDLNGTFTIRTVGIKVDGTKRQDSVTVYVYNPTAMVAVSDKSVQSNVPGAVIIAPGKIVKSLLEGDKHPPNINISGVINGINYTSQVCADIRINDENIAEYIFILRKNGEVDKLESGKENKETMICVEEEAVYSISIEARDTADNLANVSVEFSIGQAVAVNVDDNVDEVEIGQNGEVEGGSESGNDTVISLGDGLDEGLGDIVDNIIEKGKVNGSKGKPKGPGWVSVNAQGKNFVSVYSNGKKKYVINLSKFKNKGKVIEIIYTNADELENILSITNVNAKDNSSKNRIKNWITSLKNKKLKPTSIKDMIKDKDNKSAAQGKGKVKGKTVEEYSEDLKKQQKEKKDKPTKSGKKDKKNENK